SRVRPPRARQVIYGKVPSATVHLIARVFLTYVAADVQEYSIALRIAGPDQAFSPLQHDLAVRGPSEHPDFEIADLGDRQHRVQATGCTPTGYHRDHLDGLLPIVIKLVKRMNRTGVVQRIHGR